MQEMKVHVKRLSRLYTLGHYSKRKIFIIILCIMILIFLIPIIFTNKKVIEVVVNKEKDEETNYNDVPR